MKIGICPPVTGLVAYAPMKTPVFSLVSACRSTSVLAAAAFRYASTAARGLACPPVQASRVPGRPGGRHQRVDQLVLGRQHHVGGAEDGVRPGGEHPDASRAPVWSGREVDVRAGGAADPVALHQLDRLGPVQRVQVVQQPVAVRGDPHHPLLQVALEDREVAPVGPAVGGDLLVGQHGAQPGAPVHRRLETYASRWSSTICAPLGVGQLGPRPAVRGGPVAGFELGDQLGDRPGLRGVGSYQELKICRKIHCVQR